MKILINNEVRDMTPEEIAELEAANAASTTPKPDENIVNAPEDLFGGPTLKEIFDGN